MNGFTVIFASGMIESTAQTFGVNWPHFIAQCISFGIVAFCLHRFAFKPILLVLEERRQVIAESLANAEKIKLELAKTGQERQEILAQANNAADQIIAEARAAAARLLEAETQKAIATANQIIARAHEANAAELARMKMELRREVGRLVVEAAGRVTGKILTEDDHHRLAEETSRELGNN